MSRQWGCKIGRIRPKSGGAEVRVLDARDDARSQQIAADLITHAEYIIDQYEPMGGYVLVGWNLRGATTVCWRSHHGAPYKETMLPDFIRAQMAAANAAGIANDVIDERFKPYDGDA